MLTRSRTIHFLFKKTGYGSGECHPSFYRSDLGIFFPQKGLKMSFESKGLKMDQRGLKGAKKS